MKQLGRLLVPQESRWGNLLNRYTTRNKMREIISNRIINITSKQMEAEFNRILKKYGFKPDKSKLCAGIFTENSLDGVYTHGVNRFARFIKYVKNNHILVDAEPELISSAGAIEQWDGNLGPGPLNALICTDRVMELAERFGIGSVALSNTNHWMRGGTYGWKAAKAGFIFIGFTNTKSNMPAWGSVESRVGNNPMVLAVPHDEEAIVLDMAMSQYSYGTIESHARKSEKLPLPGGYNTNGELTTNPAEILESHRPIPMGYWKGTGLALLLDLLTSILSGGLSTHEISKRKSEYGVSQVFIVIDIRKLSNYSAVSQSVNMIIEDYKNSLPESDTQNIIYPGERVLMRRKENLSNGIPVEKVIWDEIIKL